MTTEVKKVEEEYRLFEYRDMVDGAGKVVQVANVGGRRIEARDINSEIQMGESEKTRAQQQIDYWTDVKEKLEAEIAKEII